MKILTVLATLICAGYAFAGDIPTGNTYPYQWVGTTTSGLLDWSSATSHDNVVTVNADCRAQYGPYARIAVWEDFPATLGSPQYALALADVTPAKGAAYFLQENDPSNGNASVRFQCLFTSGNLMRLDDDGDVTEASGCTQTDVYFMCSAPVFVPEPAAVFGLLPGLGLLSIFRRRHAKS